MQQVTDRNFGLLIAYILPGFFALLGLSTLSPTLQQWLSAASAENPPTIAGFLYVTLASVGLGMALSALRFVVIDQIHALTGLPRPRWDDAQLQANLDAFNLIVEQHYRHYQFYANSLMAMLLAYAALRSSDLYATLHESIEPLMLLIGVVFWAMARDTLRKYYTRATTVLERNTKHGKRKPSTRRKAKT